MHRITEADFYKITWRTAYDDACQRTMFIAVTSDDITILNVGDIANKEIPDGGYITAIEDIGLGFSVAKYAPPNTGVVCPAKSSSTHRCKSGRDNYQEVT